MKKFKVVWYETVANEYSTDVEAESKEEAKRIIDEDINEARTSVIEEDHAEVMEWDIQEVTEIHEK